MKFPTFAPFLLLFLTVAASSCIRPREDVREVTYAVPALAGADCSAALLRVLSTVDGVVDVKPNLAAREVTVTYNSRVTAQKNIEHAIAAGGFDVNDTPANPDAQAKLPATCQ